MPPIEEDELDQTALLWERIGTNDNGEPLLSLLPQEIDVRWENQFGGLGAISDESKYDVRIVVDRDIPKGSILRLGDLSDWQGTGSALDEQDLVEVVFSFKVPDLKAREYRRVVYCNRSRSGIVQD